MHLSIPLSRFVLAFTFVSASTTAAWACPTDLDLNFGITGGDEGGIALSDLDPGLVVSTNDSVLTENGSILLAGSVRPAGSNDAWTPTILRFTANGGVDDSFGTGGVAQLAVNGIFTSIALDADGSIVASFDVLDGNDPETAGIARFDEDGILDASFGDGGKTILDRGARVISRDLLVRSDGVIVVAGQQREEPFWQAYAYYFTSEGELDHGVELADGSVDIATSLVELDDGVVMVSGIFSGALFAGQTFLARLTADGQPDATFGTNGTRRYPLSGFQEEAWRIARDAAGRLYVSGNTTPTDKPRRTRMFVYRFDEDGDRDLGYGSQGKAQFRLRRRLAVRGLAINEDGEATLSGWFTGKHGSVIARLTPDGRRDIVFGHNGLFRITLGEGTQITQVLLQDDDKLVATGNITRYAFAMRLEGVWNGVQLCVFGCGDGEIRGLEQCDDGNHANNDGCSAACLLE